MLADKATTFIGSDLSVTTGTVASLPSSLAGTGTVVVRAQGHSGSQSVDLLGVDPATFAAAVHWRADASASSLPALLETIDAGRGPPPAPAAAAIVVHGTLPDATIVSPNGKTLTVQPAAAAGWFPSYRNGAVLVVVDRATLAASEFPRSTEVWLRDPPADALQQLRGAGLTTTGILDLSVVFDATSFLSVRWGYATFSVLAVLIGAVVLLAQLLVLDARLQQRRAAQVLTARMGLGRAGDAIALVAEIAPPLVLGGLGSATGLLVGRLSVARLDVLRQLRPPARLIVDPALLVPIVAAVGAALAVLVVTGLAMLQRTRTLEVMRGTA
jgi:putative ABC transport system permease protein